MAQILSSLLLLSLCLTVSSSTWHHYSSVKFEFEQTGNPQVKTGKSIPVHVSLNNEKSGNFVSIACAKNGKYHGSLLHYTENFSLPLQYSIKLPGFIQDTISFRLGSNRPEFLKLSSNDYKMKIKGEMDKKERFLSVMAQNGCKCVKKNCACCAYIPLPEHEALNICVNATYNSETVGLDLAIGVNGHYFTQEISLRNPPPICLGIPELEHIAGVCIAFTDLNVTKTELDGCVDFEIELIHLRVIQIKLGCFKMPI